MAKHHSEYNEIGNEIFPVISLKKLTLLKLPCASSPAFKVKNTSAGLEQ